MRDLHEMSIGQRVMLTVVIVVVVLLLLAMFGYLTGRWEEAQAKVQVACMDPKEREKVRDIVLEGIDKGLESSILHLFDIWVKDQDEQPKRAMVGTNNAVNAHMRARKQAIAWDPPPCEVGK